MRRQLKSSKSIFKSEAILIVLIMGIPIGIGLFFAFIVPALIKLLR